MTRSSNSTLVPPLEEPERTFHQLTRENQTMTDLALLSLEEYASRTRAGDDHGVIRPTIPAQTNFELKGQFLHLLRETPFAGREDEDANQHVEAILEIADYFNIVGVSKDAVMLRVFPITLQGAAKRWIKSEPTITTWEGLRTKFIKQFSPPCKIAKMKMKIQNFQQLEDETLYDAWDRYKEMLQNCPQHDLNPHQVVQTFYNGIDVCTRQLVDSQGPIPKKNPADGKAIIEELAQHSHQWHSSRDSSFRKRSTGESSDGLAALNAKLDALGRDMKKVNQTIHAIQVGCDNCSGPHLERDCPLDHDGNQKVDVCYSSGDRYDERKPRNNWKPFDEYKKEMEMQGKWRQSGQGFYQKDPPLEQIVQEKKPSFEEMMARFAEASDKRHRDTEELVKRIGSTTETALRNQQASILNIENQVGQISRVLQERFPGTLPSNTETNPTAHVKAITTRTGKILEPLVPVHTNEPSTIFTIPREEERTSSG